MITLHEVSKTYRLGKGSVVNAVCNVSLEVPRGEFLVITGRSGSGKTTLLNLAAGLTQPTQGQVLLGGAEIWRLADREQSALRNRTIGFVFQFPSLMPSLTALENVRLPATFEASGRGNGSAARAAELLELVGLPEKAGSYPRQLSAGQQQRVVVARSLINRPELLLADEPTSDLDEKTEIEIMSLFRDIHLAMGVTIVMVTHTSQLICYGTRAIEMAAGTIRT